jgi:uncharacterized protein YyaL (SSP411 family)
MLNRILPALLLAVLGGGAAGARSASLKGEPSAFLQANAGSPVDWMPWGEAAIARAKAQQKPVFLFIGSFTSELSAAMRRQTFANPKAAEWLNAHFVCVIVDREERPEVAALFQSYVSQLRQANGWPLNVWLTPDFMPFEGATYLSPSEDWGAPGFLKLAGQAQAAWASDPAACRKRAADAIAQLAPAAEPLHAWKAGKVRTQLAAAAGAWMTVFDPQRGGFGDVPRLPEPELLRFLLRQPGASREAALATLRAISSSALRDPLDSGFFRYASDASGRIPYPQKTLADQARIALAFLDGAQGADARAFQSCARGALDYALGRLGHPDGTFASAVDATGDDHAGYLTWSEAEIDRALGHEAAAFKLAHGVEAHGNIPTDDDPSGAYAGVNLLRSAASDGAPSPAALRLLALRDLRPAPPRDERATAGAHGLLLAALARAGSDLGDPRFTDAARRLFATVTKAFLVSPDGTVRRFAGSSTPAGPEDYAALALGCGGFARATGDRDARRLALLLLSRLDGQFYDPSSNRYFACPLPLGPGQFLRPMAAGDPPSAPSLALIADAPHAQAIAAALSDSLEETNAQAPGDDLLGLALYALNGLAVPSPAR